MHVSPLDATLHIDPENLGAMRESLRIAPENLGAIGPSVVPCENCAAPVSVVTVTGLSNGKDVTRLMEVQPDRLDSGLIHLHQHTPDRCRTFRAERAL